MKVRILHVPTHLDDDTDQYDTLLDAMAPGGSFPVFILNECIGYARVIEIGDDYFDVEAEMADGVDLAVDVGRYFAAGPDTPAPKGKTPLTPSEEEK